MWIRVEDRVMVHVQLHGSHPRAFLLRHPIRGESSVVAAKDTTYRSETCFPLRASDVDSMPHLHGSGVPSAAEVAPLKLRFHRILTMFDVLFDITQFDVLFDITEELPNATQFGVPSAAPVATV